MTALYDRQTALNLNIPKSVLLIGCGGIGSWIGFSMALGGVSKLTIIDPDVLEIHNLNRTPFREDQVGLPKVFAMQDLIYDRRQGVCEVDVYDCTYQNSGIDPTEYDIVVDCSDGLDCKEYLNDHEFNGKYIKLGYDGTSITIDTNIKSYVWSMGDGYRIVPSYVGSVMMIASIVTNSIMLNVDMKSITMDISDMLGRIYA